MELARPFDPESAARSATRPAVGLGLLVAVLLASSVGVVGAGAVAEDFFASGPFAALVAGLCLVIAVSAYLRLAEAKRPAVAGSILLHLALVLLAAGAGWDRIAGWIEPVRIVAGMTAPVTPDGAVRVRLDRVRPVYRSGAWSKGEAADVTVSIPGRPDRSMTLHANRPFSDGALTIHLDRHGFAPRVDLRDAGGLPRPSRVLVLDTGLAPAVRYWARLPLEPGTPELIAVFRPSPTGPFARDPALTLAPVSGAGPAVTLRPGRTARIGDRIATLGPVRYWARFSVAWQPGRRLIFAAFALAIVGALLALWPEVAHGRR